MKRSLWFLFLFTGCNVFAPPTGNNDNNSNADIASDMATPDMGERDATADTSQPDVDRDAIVDTTPDAMDMAPDLGACPTELVERENVNRRSIGTNVNALFTGVANWSDGSTTLCFADPLPPEVGEGDEVRIGVDLHYIFDRIDDFTVSVHEPFLITAADEVSISRAFNSPQTWGTQTNGNLVADQRAEEGILYKDSPFTELFVASDSTTSQQFFRHLKAGELQDHNGLAGQGVVFQSATPGHGIQINENFFRLTGVEVTGWSNNTAASLDGINIRAQNVIVDSVIVHDDGAQSTVNPDCNGIALETGAGFAIVRNSVVYNIARSGITIHGVDNAQMIVENSTVLRASLNDPAMPGYGCIVISGGTGSTMTVSNSLAGQCVADAFGVRGQTVGTMLGDFNASDDGTAVGMNSFDAVIADEVINVLAATENLHLKPDSLLRDAGDPASTLTHDIDGDERPVGGAVDIGADELPEL